MPKSSYWSWYISERSCKINCFYYFVDAFLVNMRKDNMYR